MKILKGAVATKLIILCYVSCILGAPSFVTLFRAIIPSVRVSFNPASRIALQSAAKTTAVAIGTSAAVVVTASKNKPVPPTIPKLRCDWDALKAVNEELLKKYISKSVDLYLGNRTDLDALKIKNIFCVLDGDNMDLVKNTKKWITSCFNLPNLPSTEMKMLEKLNSIIEKGQKACVFWNAVRYETIENEEKFQKTLDVTENLCNELCSI